MNQNILNINDPSITSCENQPYWIATVKPIIYEKLKRDIATDVLIIGGGISGLTIAYFLLKAGRKITLVEDGTIGSGESGRTTGHITYALDDRYFEIEKLFGKSKAMIAANSHLSAIQWLDNIISSEKIDCNYLTVPGYLFLNETDKSETLEKEFATTRRLGLLTEMCEIPGITSIGDNRCIKFPGQRQFHIMKYLKGLSEAIVRLGGLLFTESKAEEINTTGAKANGYSIKARHIVLATNKPINNIVTMHTKQWTYRTYVIASKIKKGLLPYALWWDTRNPDSSWITHPYHYVRLEPIDDEYDLLIAGGENHKVGQGYDEKVAEEDQFNKLIAWTKRKFPDIENIEYKWSGQVMEPIDSMAFIGKNPGDENIYIITGDSGNGMTHSTLAGKLISDIITGKKNLWEGLYSPSRITLKAADDYSLRAVNMSAQYAEGKVVDLK